MDKNALTVRRSVSTLASVASRAPVASRVSPRRRALTTTLPLLFAVAAAPVAFAPDAFGQGKVTFGGSASTDGSAAAPAPAAPPADAPAADAPAGDVDEEWRQRDRLLHESNTLSGSTGLLRLQHAQSGAPGQFRLGFTTEWFSAGFLCTSDFPCKNPRGGSAITGDTMNHIGATITLGVTIAKIGPGTLEGYAATGGYANSDDANRPSLLQVLGDTTLGTKYVFPLSKVFHAGIGADLLLVNGTGSVGLDGGGTSGRFTGMFTTDLRGLQSRTPLRLGLNLGYTIDNTADVLTSTEAPVASGGRGQSVTRIERFGLNVNRVDHLDLRIGGEFFAAEERVRPFVEYGIMLPNNRQSYACKPNNPSADKCLANEQVAPSSLTLGVRAFPWKRGFSLLAALDIGVTGTGKFIEEVAPTPPWMLYIGGGWAIDTQDRPPPPPVTKHIEKRVEVVKAPIMGHIKGFVHEQGKTDPIAHAIVKYDGHPEMSPLATGDDGKFGDDLSPGDYKYNVTADGYKPGTCDAKVPTAGGDVPVDCALEALPKVGTIVATVRDADTNAGIGAVTVRMVDAQKKESLLTSDGSGAVKVENLMPGTVEFTISADGYLTLVQTAEVKVRQTVNVDLVLRPKPKTAAVEVGKTEIKIKQQIQFALDSSVILPESFGLMNEIADVLIRNPRIKRVEIQGHTDNTGTPEHNKQLSQQRAESVRLWLTQHGVGGDRLVAAGYGQEKPLVPNVTANNRARNRRVQFQILDQDPAVAKP